MAEYINKDKLLERIDKLFDETSVDGEEQIGVLKSRRVIRNEPTADVVEVKHGEWVMTVYTTVSPRGRFITNKKFSCSVCKRGNGRHTTPYCPNCGAKMEGVARSNNGVKRSDLDENT